MNYQTSFYAVFILILIVFGGYFLLGKTESVSYESPNIENNGEFQKVVLSMKNLNYYPNTIKVQSGIPVRISLDESVKGCLRSFTIRDFGVAKYLKTPGEYVEFMPNKKGTFGFTCSMGMGRGTLIVE